MMRKGVALVAWLVVGHAALAGLFWALVNTPESNTLMLLLSALLVLALVAGLALVQGTAAAALLPARTFGDAVRDGLRSVPAILIALVALAACWWVAGRVDAWHDAHRGEIDAWMIARFNAPEATGPHRLIDVVSFLVRGVLGVSLAIALLFAWLEGGARALLRTGWLRAAVSRDQVTLVAIGMTLFVALPWHFATWRPAEMPITWVQPTFAAAKLALIFVAMNVGWLICLLGGARNASARG